jgi:hypothetical protein
MPVKKTECCNMHTKEKEKSGTCCQTKENEDEEQSKEQNE